VFEVANNWKLHATLHFLQVYQSYLKLFNIVLDVNQKRFSHLLFANQR
jgi:hypothetical protein